MTGELRLANGLTVADVAQVEIELQRRIDDGRVVLVEGLGYVTRSALADFRSTPSEAPDAQ